MISLYPLPREIRQTAILTTDGVAQTVGPFNFQIFDTADVSVWWRLPGGDWHENSAVTVTKTSDIALADFTVTFDTLPASGIEYVVTSERLHERDTDVTRGGALNSNALERELSKQGTVLQELRRDIDFGLRLPPGTPGITVQPIYEGHFWKADDSGNMVDGGSAADIVSAQGYAATAAAERALAEAAATTAQNALSSVVQNASAKFESVAAFLADNNERVGYAGSGAIAELEPGEIVETPQHRYVAADPSAADEHVTTVGGFKAYVLKNIAGAWSAEAFGLFESNTPAQNSAVFERMAAGTGPGQTWSFADGTFRYEGGHVLPNDTTFFMSPRTNLRRTSLPGYGFTCRGDVFNIISLGGAIVSDEINAPDMTLPAGSISNIEAQTTGAFAGRCKVTTSAPHGLERNNHITISGVVGATEANGVHRIWDVTETTFTLMDATFANAYVSGGEIFKSDYALGASGMDRSIFLVEAKRFNRDRVSVQTPTRNGFYLVGCEYMSCTNSRENIGGMTYDRWDTLAMLTLSDHYINPPTAGCKPTITGNAYQSFVTPINGAELGGLGGSGLIVQPIIAHNRCDGSLDHMLYMISTVGAVVAYNVGQNTRKPIAVSGTRLVCVGNNFGVTGSHPDEHLCTFSIRDPQNARIADNTLRGAGAAIDCSVLHEQIAFDDVVVEGNLLSETVPTNQGLFGIRFNTTTNTPSAGNCKIVGNTIMKATNGAATDTTGAITVFSPGPSQDQWFKNLDISRNAVSMSGNRLAVYLDGVSGFNFTGNTFNRSYTGATSFYEMRIANCGGGKIFNNDFNYTKNGNAGLGWIWLRLENSSLGVYAIDQNRFDVWTVPLAARTFYSLVTPSGGSRVMDYGSNQYDTDAPLFVDMVLSAGTGATAYATNRNVVHADTVLAAVASINDGNSARLLADTGVYFQLNLAANQFRALRGAGGTFAVSGTIKVRING